MPETIVKDIRINVTGTIPGEQIVVAVLNYAATNRATMSQENRDKWDALGIAVFEEWRAFWKKIGVI